MSMGVLLQWLYVRLMRRKTVTGVVTLLFAALLVAYNMWRPDAPVQKAILNQTYINISHRIMKDYASNSRNIPLLLLFTTFHPTLPKSHIFENTLRNWALLRPIVQPVMFYDTDLNRKWKERLKSLGWGLVPIPKPNAYDLPVLRFLFETAIDMYPAHYYGYANGDVLFDESLVLTLHALYQHPVIEDFFLIGRRINYPIPTGHQFYNLAEVRQYAGRDQAEMFIKEAQDYFITTKGGIPWDNIPSFVVGRVGYDNWLVSYAMQNGPVVIDGTNTLLCLHQTGSDGIYSGSKTKRLRTYNLDKVPRGFNYGLGTTDCALWFSRFSRRTTAIVFRRRSSKYCYGHQNTYFENQDLSLSD